MNFNFAHVNFNVIDLDKSIAFYQEALGLEIAKRLDFEERGFTLVYMKDSKSNFTLELTYLKNWPNDKYNLGDEEFHLAFEVEDLEAARAKHEAMGCVKFVNEEMGIYFISDPDGYWLEIISSK